MHSPGKCPCVLIPRQPRSTLFPYTTLFRSMAGSLWRQRTDSTLAEQLTDGPGYDYQPDWSPDGRSEEHTSELQSRVDLVCRLLLEKKKSDVIAIRSFGTYPAYF